MGLQSELSLTAVTPNFMQRTLQRMGATAIGTAVFSVVMAPVDRVVHKMSKGRVTAGRSLGALPVVMLMTVGARTGERRTTPLSAVPFAEDLALIGTNYGRGRTPAWAHNLRANPQAVVTHQDRECSVVAVEADDEQYEAAFAAAIRVYPGYARYRRKAVNEIPVFLLTSRGST